MSKISQNTGTVPSLFPGAQASDGASGQDVLFAALFGAQVTLEDADVSEQVAPVKTVSETDISEDGVAADINLAAVTDVSAVLAGGLHSLAQHQNSSEGHTEEGAAHAPAPQPHPEGAKIHLSAQRRAGLQGHNQNLPEQSDENEPGTDNSGSSEAELVTVMPNIQKSKSQRHKKPASMIAGQNARSEAIAEKARQTPTHVSAHKTKAPAEPASLIKASELKAERLSGEQKSETSISEQTVTKSEFSSKDGQSRGQNSGGQHSGNHNPGEQSTEPQNSRHTHLASSQISPSPNTADKITPSQNNSELQQASTSPEDWQDMLDLMEDNWSELLVRRIQNALGDNKGGIDFELNPRNLGKLRVTLSMNGDHTQVQMRTETQQAAQILSDAESRLAQMLEQSGLKLSQFGTHSGMSGGNHHNMNNSSGQNSSRQNDNSVSSNKTEDDESNETQHSPDDGRVNLRA